MDKQISQGLYGLGFAVFISLFYPSVGVILLMIASLYFVTSGLSEIPSRSNSLGTGGKLKSGQQNDSNIPQTSSAPITDEPTIADRIRQVNLKNGSKCPNCGANVEPTEIKCKHCESILVDTINLPRPETWADVEIGQTIVVNHPKDGKMNFSVQSRIYYGELWQVKMRPDVPWTLTGGYYVRLSLDKNIFLMNWQNRFYIFDTRQPLTDMDINRDFVPYARKFAASNQTARVSFNYQKATWHVEDIGRFRIEFTEGDEVRVNPGTVGRFIHASQNLFTNKILVVEDYQSGGNGLDAVWTGYRIEETDIKL